MANVTGYPAYVSAPGLFEVDFNFDTNAAANPASVKGRRIASVTRTGVGTYLVTLQDLWPAISSISADLQQPSATGNWVLVGPINLTAKTITIYTMNPGGTATVDIAADPNSRVWVNVMFKNSSVT